MTMALLPDTEELDDLEIVEQSSNTFIAGGDQIAGMADGLEAVRQTVQNILQTERFDYQIYSTNYGVELNDLVGEDPDYIEATLPARIEDALSVDDRILSVDDFTFDFSGDKAAVTCNVQTVYGTVNTGVQI